MNRAEILDALHNGTQIVTFTKQNGDERVMRCTLKHDILKGVVPNFDPEHYKSERASNPDLCVVWDLTSEGWRSFRVDSFITMRPDEE